MKISDYIKDRIGMILMLLLIAVLNSIILCLMGNPWIIVIMLDILFGSLLIIFFISEYLRHNKYWKEINHTTEELDQKYLITEIADIPPTEEGKMYIELLKIAAKSMLENVSHQKRDKNEYQEVIEMWVHEIKGPLTGAKLICENNKLECTKKLSLELAVIQNAVEKIMYFARMGAETNDFKIKNTDIYQIVIKVLRKNKQYLIQHNAMIDTKDLEGYVYTDEKCIEFIINQIINNSIKYRSNKNLNITLRTAVRGNKLELGIKDNGIGIKQSDIRRVFDKGFTGANGNSNEYSTGLGLYICYKLCEKLGIVIEIKAAENQYTEVVLKLPIHDLGTNLTKL